MNISFEYNPQMWRNNTGHQGSFYAEGNGCSFSSMTYASNCCGLKTMCDVQMSLSGTTEHVRDWFRQVLTHPSAAAFNRGAFSIQLVQHHHESEGYYDEDGDWIDQTEEGHKEMEYERYRPYLEAAGFKEVAVYHNHNSGNIIHQWLWMAEEVK